LEEIHAFVLDWYTCIDRREPVTTLLACIARADLEMVLPHETIRGASAFRDWYERWCAQTPPVRHDVKELQVSWDKTSGFTAECMVHQRTRNSSGSTNVRASHVRWRFRVTSAGSIELLRYAAR
jgi:hypothetical protein